MNTLLLCYLTIVLTYSICAVSAESIHRRGEKGLDTITAQGRKLPYNCDYVGKKGGDYSGKKGGASCDIPSCCKCDCSELENEGGKNGGGGSQVCECDCDCNDDDDDDDDDDGPEPVPKPTPAPTRHPTRSPVGDDDDDDDDDEPAPKPTPAPTRHPTRHPTPVGDDDDDDDDGDEHFPPCNVCGKGGSINLPEALVEVSEYGWIKCGDLERKGLHRHISPYQCPHIPSQINAVCGCNPSCDICGNGRSVGKPYALVNLPEATPVYCGALQDYGLAGSIKPSECSAIPDIVYNKCQCDPPLCSGKKGGKGSKKGGCSPSSGYSSGKKGGYSYGKKGGYSSGENEGYSSAEKGGYSYGKKGGYSSGKKAGYTTYGGKKGGYGGKKGGYVPPVVAPVAGYSGEEEGHSYRSY